MAKFEVGDKVKMVAIVSKAKDWGDGWADSMDNYYLKIGTVTEVREGNNFIVMFPSDIHNDFCYPKQALKLVKE